jgi:DNA repair exonuclease SbcCD ATPase subunit/DNA repair exonuclease SbcCD nuclease subunit
MQFIDIGIKKIDKIFHIADVHIRNVNRHKEYSDVFKKLYSYIQKNKTDDSLIYVAGDIVHAKTDMSPELIEMTSGFFRSLADIAPTIIITGNHDCNLNNSNRLDALSPIVKALKHKNIHYLKDNGIYKISDVHFNVMSVFEKPVNYIKADEFEGDIKIALHHGAVDSAKTDIGYEISNNHVKTSLFDGHDLVLLGDIHKPEQYLNDEKTIAYPGSLIQQNHGEALTHGIMEWDLDSMTGKFIEIPNQFGYYTFEIENGKILNPSDKVPLRPRLRLKVKETAAADLKQVVSEIRKKYKVQEIAIQKVHSLNVGNGAQKLSIGNVRDVEWQNKIISDYLDSEHAVSDEMLDIVRHINRTVHSKLPDSEITRNVVWVPKRFEFSNMFSYGEDNVIDFANVNGINGLFAANASGKSTLLDSLAFCCFDRCSRTTKAVHVLNNKKTTFYCRFEFDLDGKPFVIERNAKKQSNGHVKVNVDFWTYDSSGEQVLLNGDQRDHTNKIIRKYIGSYDDFILTALSLQNNNTGFIDMSQRERKELLTQFLDIDVFEKQYQIAAEDSRDTAALIREYKRTDYSTVIAESIQTIDQLTAPFKRIQKEKNTHRKMFNDLNDIVITMTSELKTISNDVLTIDEAQAKIDKLKEAREEYDEFLQTKKDLIQSYKDNISEYTEMSAGYDRVALETEKARMDHLHELIRDIQNNKVPILEAEIKAAERLESKLADHKWDPNCEYCMANPWLHEAQKASDDLPGMNRELLKFKSIEQEYHEEILESEAHNRLVELNDFEASIERNQRRLDSEEQILKSYHSKTQLHDTWMASAIEKLEEAKQYESDIKFNKDKQEEIDDVITERNDLSTEIKRLESNILTMSGKIEVAKKNKENAEESINRLRELELQYKGYEYYLQSIKRDGVPYQLITKAIPQIEAEINNILTQVVDFTMILDTDGKNINGYIVYDSDNYWPLELTSGMEKFISSLAIRTSLINITSLPRPNFLAIDEGFGVLDSENLNNMYLLFDYLKSQFGFVLCISHIDAMRDIVDSLIEIKKVSGYSKINYS